MTNVQQHRQQRSRIVGNDASIDHGVGNRLHDYYEPITREPIPDRFLDLLGLLERTDGAGIAVRVRLTKDDRLLYSK